MITSALKKQIKKLQQKKYRYEDGLFTVEGKKGVEEALRNAQVTVVVVQMDVAGDFGEILALAKKQKIRVEECTTKDVKEIQSTETFPGIMAIVEMPETRVANLDTIAPILCLDRVADPGNLGTIIRTADWFGVRSILLSEDCVDPYNDKTVRSTMGSLFHVQIAQSRDFLGDIEKMQKKGYSVITLALGGKPISTLPKAKKQLYVFGSESHGVRAEVLERGEAYTIPGFGSAESLNVGVAVGVVLYAIKV